MSVKLWLDDVRPAPEGWEWAKSYDDALIILRDGLICDASLDHDLGFNLEDSQCSYDTLYIPEAPYDKTALTGYDLTRWIMVNDAWPEHSIAVHSLNPIGHLNMCRVIERYGPYVYRQAVRYSNAGNTIAVRYTKV